ncbi:MAG: hypothetical protein IKN59_02500 [Paludibacteraceae bacterium]|nr:hypothetical protein [Paludibacteraceae bacterium]
MKKYLLLAALLIAGTLVSIDAKRPTKSEVAMQQFKYELECAGNGVQGTYLVRVWTYSKKLKDAQAAGARNAVHGVVFKGFAGGDGCVGQRALASGPGAELEYEDYFKRFFADNGEYRKYVSLVVGTEEILKVGKEYKVGVVVSVQKDELRKALEAAGVIKGLNYGF